MVIYFYNKKMISTRLLTLIIMVIMISSMIPLKSGVGGEKSIDLSNFNLDNDPVIGKPVRENMLKENQIGKINGGYTDIGNGNYMDEFGNVYTNEEKNQKNLGLQDVSYPQDWIQGVVKTITHRLEPTVNSMKTAELKIIQKRNNEARTTYSKQTTMELVQGTWPNGYYYFINQGAVCDPAGWGTNPGPTNPGCKEARIESHFVTDENEWTTFTRKLQDGIIVSDSISYKSMNFDGAYPIDTPDMDVRWGPMTSARNRLESPTIVPTDWDFELPVETYIVKTQEGETLETVYKRIITIRERFATSGWKISDVEWIPNESYFVFGTQSLTYTHLFFYDYNARVYGEVISFRDRYFDIDSQYEYVPASSALTGVDELGDPNVVLWMDKSIHIFDWGNAYTMLPWQDTVQTGFESAASVSIDSYNNYKQNPDYEVSRIRYEETDSGIGGSFSYDRYDKDLHTFKTIINRYPEAIPSQLEFEAAVQADTNIPSAKGVGVTPSTSISGDPLDPLEAARPLYVIGALIILGASLAVLSASSVATVGRIGIEATEVVPMIEGGEINFGGAGLEGPSGEIVKIIAGSLIIIVPGTPVWYFLQMVTDAVWNKLEPAADRFLQCVRIQSIDTGDPINDAMTVLSCIAELVLVIKLIENGFRPPSPKLLVLMLAMHLIFKGLEETSNYVVTYYSDYDNDGYSDLWEVQHFTNPLIQGLGPMPYLDTFENSLDIDLIWDEYNDGGMAQQIKVGGGLEMLYTGGGVGYQASRITKDVDLGYLGSISSSVNYQHISGSGNIMMVGRDVDGDKTLEIGTYMAGSSQSVMINGYDSAGQLVTNSMETYITKIGAGDMEVNIKVNSESSTTVLVDINGVVHQVTLNGLGETVSMSLEYIQLAEDYDITSYTNWQYYAEADNGKIGPVTYEKNNDFEDPLIRAHVENDEGITIEFYEGWEIVDVENHDHEYIEQVTDPTGLRGGMVMRLKPEYPSYGYDILEEFPTKTILADDYIQDGSVEAWMSTVDLSGLVIRGTSVSWGGIPTVDLESGYAAFIWSGPVAAGIPQGNYLMLYRIENHQYEELLAYTLVDLGASEWWHLKLSATGDVLKVWYSLTETFNVLPDLLWVTTADAIKHTMGYVGLTAPGENWASSTGGTLFDDMKTIHSADQIMKLDISGDAMEIPGGVILTPNEQYNAGSYSTELSSVAYDYTFSGVLLSSPDYGTQEADAFYFYFYYDKIPQNENDIAAKNGYMLVVDLYEDKISLYSGKSTTPIYTETVVLESEMYQFMIEFDIQENGDVYIIVKIGDDRFGKGYQNSWLLLTPSLKGNIFGVGARTGTTKSQNMVLELGLSRKMLGSDTDGDGLSDYDEIYWGYDVNNPDTDGDGLSDLWELTHEVSNAARDPDRDDLNNLEEYNAGTDPNNADTDGDGLTDGEEVNGVYGGYKTDPNNADTDYDSITDYDELIPGLISSPLLKDTDGDGLEDDIELAIGTDPWNDADYDGDGLSDYIEYGKSQTSPFLQNTDGEWYNDYDEYMIYGTSGAHPDTDFDGIDDGDEILGTYGYLTDPLYSDTDNDGLNDYEEINAIYGYNTDPNNPDHDGDEILDGHEITYGSDPLSSGSIPTVDTDTDNLTDYEEDVIYYTDPLDDDTDGDIIIDGNEVSGITGYITIPWMWDTDLDGLSDFEEIYASYGYYTDPNNPDCDGDGLSDYEEVNAVYGWTTDPNKEDHDNDGILDGEEYILGIDGYVTIPVLWDTDIDELGDGWEIQNNFNPVSMQGEGETDDDPDDDGYTNLQEQDAGTDPWVDEEVPVIIWVSHTEMDWVSGQIIPTSIATGMGSENFFYIVEIDNVSWTQGYEWDTTIFADGSLHTIEYRVSDGSNSVSIIVNVQIDNLAPTSTTPLVDLTTVAGNNVLFSFTPNDILSGIDDSQNMITYMGTTVVGETSAYWDVTGIADGEYTLRFTTVDNAGNIFERTVQIRVDNNPPVIESVSHPVYQWVFGTVSLEQIVTGGLTFQILVDGLVISLGTVANWDTSLEEDGLHEIIFRAMDNMYTVEYVVSLYVDNNGPEITFADYTGGENVNGTIVLQYTMTDASSLESSEFYMNGGNPTVEEDGIPYTYDYIWVTTDYPDGSYTILFRVYDMWGQHTDHIIILNTINYIDTDGDELLDKDEPAWGTSIYNPDSDGDGIPDGWETLWGSAMHPMTWDSGDNDDNDGLTNLGEYNMRLTWSTWTDPTNWDTDLDGMSDGWEDNYGFDPTVSSNAGDTDGDGVKDINEYISGTNPLESNTVFYNMENNQRPSGDYSSYTHGGTWATNTISYAGSYGLYAYGGTDTYNAALMDMTFSDGYIEGWIKPGTNYWQNSGFWIRASDSGGSLPNGYVVMLYNHYLRIYRSVDGNLQYIDGIDLGETISGKWWHIKFKAVGDNIMAWVSKTDTVHYLAPSLSYNIAGDTTKYYDGRTGFSHRGPTAYGHTYFDNIHIVDIASGYTDSLSDGIMNNEWIVRESYTGSYCTLSEISGGLKFKYNGGYASGNWINHGYMKDIGTSVTDVYFSYSWSVVSGKMGIISMLGYSDTGKATFWISGLYDAWSGSTKKVYTRVYDTNGDVSITDEQVYSTGADAGAGTMHVSFEGSQITLRITSSMSTPEFINTYQAGLSTAKVYVYVSWHTTYWSASSYFMMTYYAESIEN